jgi:hypothetical protein
MTITEKALSDLLHKYFTTLEPVAKDVTLKNEMKKVAQPDGSTKVQMVPEKGDVYIPAEFSKSMALAIAKTFWPLIVDDTKSPQGTWLTGGVTVSFGPRAGQPGTSRLTLQDNLRRTMTTGTWAISNGVADWGYDEAASQGNNKWLYFYAVPKSGDNTKLVIKASDNTPDVGPAGHKGKFKIVWVTYISSGALRRLYQNGNRFLHPASIFSSSLPVSFAWDYAGTDHTIDDVVPRTAIEALVYASIIHTNFTGDQIGLFVGPKGAHWGTVRPYVRGALDINSQHGSVALESGLVSKQIRKRNDDWVGGGTGASRLLSQEVMFNGFVDEWIDP